jgi:hypothetical protein
VNNIVVVDTGYWFALLDPRDGLYKQAQPKASCIESMTIVFPWPVLYETLNTRSVKNPPGIGRFERIIKRRNVCRIDDTRYRDTALEETLGEALAGRRSISLCDMVIRLMLQDTNLKIHALLTFNPRDFIDVRRGAGVQIL